MATSSSTVTPNQVYIGNIAFDSEHDELKALFETCGPVKDFRMLRDSQTNVFRGVAFCTYVSDASARAAIRNLNGEKFKERPLKVEAHDRAKKQTGAAQIPGAPPPPPPPGPTPSAVSPPPGPPPLPSHGYGASLPPDAPPVLSVLVRDEEVPAVGESEVTLKAIRKMTVAQLLYVLGNTQKLVEKSPDVARTLFFENPQLTDALLHALMVCGVLKTDVLPLGDSDARLLEEIARDKEAQLEREGLIVRPRERTHLLGRPGGATGADGGGLGAMGGNLSPFDPADIRFHQGSGVLHIPGGKRSAPGDPQVDALTQWKRQRTGGEDPGPLVSLFPTPSALHPRYGGAAAAAVGTGLGRGGALISAPTGAPLLHGVVSQPPPVSSASLGGATRGSLGLLGHAPPPIGTGGAPAAAYDPGLLPPAHLGSTAGGGAGIGGITRAEAQAILNEDPILTQRVRGLLNRLKSGDQADKSLAATELQTLPEQLKPRALQVLDAIDVIDGKS